MTRKEKTSRRNWVFYQLNQVIGILNSVEDSDFSTEREKLEVMRAKEHVRLLTTMKENLWK